MTCWIKCGLTGVVVAAVAGCANFNERAERPGKQEHSFPAPANIAEKIVLPMPFDQAQLTAEHKTEIDEFLKTMRAHFGAGVTISAVIVATHTDRIGSFAYNMEISERLAEQVKDYLVKVQHFDASLISWDGKGPTQPIPVTKFCDDQLDLKQRIECLAPNRRVTIEFVRNAMPQPVLTESPTSEFHSPP